MAALAKRVQILFMPEQWAHLQRLGKAEGKSVGALVREAVARAYSQGEAPERLAAVQRMASLRLPVSGWEEMERESMRGCDVE
jgi:hypothetical protein